MGVCKCVYCSVKCIEMYPRSWMFPVCSQCGTSFSRASLTGCGGSAWRSSTTRRRRHMKTLSWCSRPALWLCPLLHTCYAAWHPMQGTAYTSIQLYIRAVRWLMNCSSSSRLCVLSFCRGIFKLLVTFQLENKDNPSYTGTHTLRTLCCTDLFFPRKCDRTALWL